MIPNDLSAFARARILRKLLFLTTCLLTGCTALSGIGGSSRDDGGGGEPSVEIAFTEDPNDPLLARAKTDEGDEFAVFVERADDGEPIALRELAIQLADGTVVTAIADDSGRPVRFEDGNSSVTIIYRKSDAAVVYADAEGVTTETVVSLPEAARPAPKATVAFQAIETDFLCAELLASYRSIVTVVFDCSDTPESPLCSSVIAQAARASLRLCSEDATIVPDEQLETEIVTDLDTLGLGIALSVVAVANTRNEAGGTILELDAVATGGTGPYTIRWEIVEGPMSPIVPDGLSTEVALNQTGTYTIVVTATDSGGESATETIIVDVVVDTPAVPLSANAGSDRTATSGIAIVLEGSATGGDGDYAYEWSPTTGLSDRLAAAPTLTLDELGMFTYTLTVTDGEGAEAADSTTILVVEPLVASAGSNKTVIIGQTLTLQGSASGGDGNYIYKWAPTTGLSDPTVAQPTLNTAGMGFGATEFTLTVSDGTGATASDALTITVSGGGGGGPAPTAINSVKWGPDFAGGGYQVLVEFSQGMNQASAETLTSYRINGTATNPTSASLVGNTVTLVFAVAMKTTDTVDVSVGASILDTFGRTFSETLNQAIVANAGDTTAPTISSTAWAANFAGAGYQLTVVFNEAMDETTAETLANYRINGTATNPATASLGTDGKTVTLTFTALALDTANTIDVSLAAAITDINAQAKTQVLAQAIAANVETNAPTVSSATRVNATTVDIVLNEATDETTAEAAAYVFSGATTLTSAALQTDGVTVRLTVGTADPATQTVTVPTTVTDINGRALAAPFVSGAL